MPDSLVPLVVSSGLGFGVIAGVVSGICYIFIHGYKNCPRSKRGKYGVNNPWQCCICGVHFSNFEISNTDNREEVNISGANSTNEQIIPVPKKYSVCDVCHGNACRFTCGQWVSERDAWLCKQCILLDLQSKTRDAVLGGKESRSWFKSILTALQPNAITVRMSKPRIKNSSEQSGSGSRNTGNESKKQDIANDGDEREIVRDFIERLVGAMLGADLDDTSVGKLYEDPQYLPVTGQTPCTAHASLKNIIRRVLRDASNIAILKEPQNEAAADEATTNKTYEDLLATAILNKVIDNYQSDLRRSSSGSSSSKHSENSKKHKNRHYDEERWRANIDNPDMDTTSMSSVEEWCRSESSCGSKYVDHMSFTIQQSIEEITTSDDDHPNNHYLHTHNLSRNSIRNGDKENDVNREDWQDNWLFSRKGKGSPKPVPVPMLVPNPSTDYRALIGDRDAEDTTDLSETGSDLDEETDSVQDIKTILIDSRTVIGGKNLLNTLNTDLDESIKINTDETDHLQKMDNKRNELNTAAAAAAAADDANKDSGVDEDLVSEARNNTLIQETPYVESDSLSSNTEKDVEYTEKYASIPRQISKEKKHPMPSPRTSKNSINDKQQEELIQLHNEMENNNQLVKSEHNEENETDDGDNNDVEEEIPIIIKAGSYSEKEREKWRNPVALANNPYSKENLDKRLNNKSNIDDHIFGRDYYIREAKRAAGGRRSLQDEEDSTTESSGHDFEPESLSVTQETSLNTDQEHIFTAVPAVIAEDDESTDFDSMSVSRPISLALSTDSEDVKVYNIETGKVTTYKNKARDIIIEDSKSPEGSKNIVSPNILISSNLSDETDSKFDENQNISKEKNREPIMNISKLNFLLNTPVSVSVPTTPVSKETFLMSQLSLTEPVVNLADKKEVQEQEQKQLQQDEKIELSSPVIPEMRDISKKYLQSLVKSKVKTPDSEQVITFDEPKNDIPITPTVTTPPISIHEEDSTENIVEDSMKNLIEIETKDTDQIQLNHKSCIDLRFIDHKNSLKTQLSVDSFLANSTPNLNDDQLYESEIIRKPTDLDELEAIEKPSVKDLKKLFDQDKPSKINISRSKSNLTTKPEFKAHRQIHSLTARSLSKEFRREPIPEFQNITNTNDAILENNGAEEQSKQEVKDELEIIPTCKSKIAFFETLKK